MKLFGITGDGTTRLATPATTSAFWLPGAAAGAGAGGGGATNNARPFLEKTWAVDEYRRLYLRAMARILRDGFNPAAIQSRAAGLTDLIRPHVAEDPNKAYSLAQFEAAREATVSNIPGINGFTRDRYAFLRNYLNGEARPVDIRLSEVTPVNPGSHRDEAGDADPWVEIQNLGPGPVTLNGFHLTDDLANPSKWALPAVTLPDGGHLILWLDGESNEGPAHASFRMPAAGGALHLFAAEVSASAPLDSVEVNTLPAGQSRIRLGLHGRTWATTAEPTPNSSNRLAPPSAPATGQLLINEIMAANDRAYEDPDEPGAFEDWFEIHNPGPAPVDMTGMYISDDPSNPRKWRAGAGLTIPAGGYLVFLAGGEPSQGPRHVDFSLSANGESLLIHAADGTTLIDSVTFGPQTADVAFGRSGGAWTLLSAPTPGAGNASPRQ